MLFNSLGFAIFLPIVFILYWFVLNKNLKIQNALLLISSLYFYSCWDYRFLFLLMFSIILDYYSALKIHTASLGSIKKFWLTLSICINLGFLAVFKYYDFFVHTFIDMLSSVGIKANLLTLNIILPVGISFYTFHGLSYIIDVYKQKTQPTENFIDYSVFVSFFPLLVAGPIERSTHLLPQIQSERKFDYSKASDGLRQILWGLFKKIVIADNCAEFANIAFNNCDNLNGSELFLGIIFFSFQIYGDFSGYSDIALGTARLFGIDLLKNFSYPYFSRDIAEFWRRWHISLSSWFRDYVYIPLGGNKGSQAMIVRNTFIIFLISGFWHGANLTFIVWGILHAIYFIPLQLLKKHRQHIDIIAQDNILPSFSELFKMAATYGMVCFAWILFRAENLEHAIRYIKILFSPSLFALPNGDTFMHTTYPFLQIASLLLIFISIEWLGRKKNFPLEDLNKKITLPIRWAMYFTIGFTILYFTGKEQQFIYFQF